MRRKLRLFFIVVGSIVALLLAIWCILAWYIQVHKKELLQNLTGQLNKSTTGVLQIEDIEPSFMATLPYFSVRLKNVSLHDSLWKYHHHDLLTAGKIYLQLNPFSLFKHNPVIHQITVKDGAVYLFTDSTGYTNSYLLLRKDTTEIKSKSQAVFNKLLLEHVRLVFDDRIKHKLFDFNIQNLTGKIFYADSGWQLKTTIKARINSLTFNASKGSFLKNKFLTASFEMAYNYAKKTLSVPLQPLYLDDHLYNTKASFTFSDIPEFEIAVSSSQIRFHDAAALTAPNIAHHFDSFDLEKPADVSAIIKGHLTYRDTPLVEVQWRVRDNTLHTPVGAIERCDLDGSFTNEVVAGGSHTDNNSEIDFSHFKGVFQGVPFKADTVHVSNLQKPKLYCHVETSFPVKELNKLTGWETVNFGAGKANADLIYRGGISEDDTTRPYISGYARVEDASITYLPRNIAFNNVFAQIHFNGSDLYISNVRLRSGQSTLAMDGSVKNFLSLYFNAPDRILLNWNIKSPFINLDEFKSFFQKRQTYGNAIVRHYQKLRVIRKLDAVLDACNVNMNLQVNKLLYRTFAATDINADILLSRQGVQVKSLKLQHAGGTLNATGNILQNPAGDGTFDVHALVSKVKIDQLFYSFGNFGQEVLGAKNIRGDLDAKVDLTGIMNENAHIQPNSMQGKVLFDIKNGALMHFELLENISKFAFKKRNLSYVTFGTMKNELIVDKERVIIPPMVVYTSALNFQLQGVYSPKTTTDMTLEVALRNPREDSVALSQGKYETRDWRKGLILFLKATNGADGKLAIGWDRKKGIMMNTKKDTRMERREKRRARRRKK